MAFAGSLSSDLRHVVEVDLHSRSSLSSQSDSIDSELFVRNLPGGNFAAMRQFCGAL